MIDGTTLTLLVACVEDDPASARLLEECLTAAGRTGVFTRSGSRRLRCSSPRSARCGTCAGARLFTQSIKDGGLGFGTAVVSNAFLLVILGGVVAFTVQQRLAGRRERLAGVMAGA